MTLAQKLYEAWRDHAITQARADGAVVLPPPPWAELPQEGKSRFAAVAGCARRELSTPQEPTVAARDRTVALIDVRAAADRITYDFDRDGWVVVQCPWTLDEADSVDGTDRRPDRYAGPGGRETIDRMRDLAHDTVSDPQLADLVFAFTCNATALAYRDRAGKKGDAALDLRKAEFWDAMAEHVIDPSACPDPRHKRPDFEPYERKPFEGPAGMAANRLLRQ
jgi:hypothetical protein